MSYYRRLIEESEKKRILGMHNTYNKSRLLTIREAYSGTAGEKFDSVEACKKQLPYNVATTLGINWKQAKTSWGSDGSSQQNLVLRDAMCDGWRIGDAKEGVAKPAIDQSKVQSGGDETTAQPTNADEFIKKESGNELLSSFGPEKFEVFKKIPNLIQGTMGQSSPSDYAAMPSLQGKLPTTDFLYWVANQLSAGETMPTYYLENGLIIKLNDDKKDAKILGNWLQGTIPGATGTQGAPEEKPKTQEKQKFIEPTF